MKCVMQSEDLFLFIFSLLRIAGYYNFFPDQPCLKRSRGQLKGD
jgi:hypothetical protein